MIILSSVSMIKSAEWFNVFFLMMVDLEPGPIFESTRYFYLLVPIEWNVYSRSTKSECLELFNPIIITLIHFFEILKQGKLLICDYYLPFCWLSGNIHPKRMIFNEVHRSWILKENTQLTFTCSKSAIETVEKGVEYVQS